MMRAAPHLPLAILLAVSAGTGSALGGILQLHSPDEVGGGPPLDFEGFAHLTVANTLFQAEGLLLTRDDGQPVFIFDFDDTSSPPNVLATVLGFGTPGSTSWATHLNVVSSTPLLAVGAYFGNDQSSADFSRIRMSVYDSGGESLGFVEVAVNGNRSVDQFIGLRSDVPFSHIRFDNLMPSGLPSSSLAVILDDLAYAAVPEPHEFTFVAAFCLAAFIAWRRRSSISVNKEG
jgi:hypothetical protein